MVAETGLKLYTEEQLQAVMAERSSIAVVQMTSSEKRRPVDLFEETPDKVKSAEW